MGNALAKPAGAAKKKRRNEEVRDLRKRNSLVFSVIDWIDAVDSDKVKALVAKRSKENTAAAAAPAKKGFVDPRGNRSTKVAEAVLGGNMRKLREVVIAQWIQINKRYGTMDNETLLHMVCREGYVRMVEFITDERNISQFETVRLDCNVENDKKRTPLHLVFTPPHETRCAKKFGLAETGLPKSEKPEGVVSDADWARPGSEKDRQRCVEILIEQGADVNRPDFHNFTPLHFACIWGWVPTASLLMAKGADPAVASVSGQNCLMAAAELKGRTPIFDFILSETHIQIEAKDADGATALHYAARAGDVDLVICLCEYAADVDVETYAKDSPLKIACRTNDIEVIQALLDHRASRRPEALSLLTGDVKKAVEERLGKEKEAKLKDFQLAKEKQQQQQRSSGATTGTTGFLRPDNAVSSDGVGEWRPYKDRRGRGIFYYNKVSRVSQFEVPDDYEKDRSYVVREQTFGLHFYH